MGINMDLGQCIVVVVLLGCVQVTVSKNVHNFDIQPSTGSEPLTLLWGIADTTAYVGRLFTYKLPNDAFQGNIVNYEIAAAGKGTLPDWLVFNPLKTELQGIPPPEARGQLYLEVKVTGDDNSQATDVFSIEVLDDTNGQISAIPSSDSTKAVRCRQEEPQTIVTVVVDCDLHMMQPDAKINLLNNMASHLNLAPEVMKMLPVGNKPMFDSGALVIGPGNVKEPQTSGGLLSWMVGCGQVHDHHMSVLQQVENGAANGDMSSAIGQDVIGWHVTNTHFQKKQRKRRNAATETQTYNPPAPTKVVETTSTERIESSSVVIMPSKSVVMETTEMPKETSSAMKMSSSMEIAPSETSTMSKSVMSTSTPVLPSTSTLVMTTSTVTEEVKPTATETTASTTTPKTTTAAPTPKPRCPLDSTREKPEIVDPLRDITIDAGHIKKIKLSEDMIFDCYSGFTSDLDLEISNADGSDPPSGFWLQLKQRFGRPYTILSNPLNTDVGTYPMKLTVTNMYGGQVEQEFNVIVKGGMEAGSEPNHELSMSIDTDYDEFMADFDNRIELSNKVASIFGDKNSKSLTVTRLERGSVVYAWTNNSVDTSGCPIESIKGLVGKMFNDDGSLTQEAKDAMYPYTINSAGAVPAGSCENNPNFPARSMSAATPAPTVKPETPTSKPVKPTDKTTMKPKPATTEPEDIPDETDTGVKTTGKPIKPTKTTPESDKKTTEAVASAGSGGGGSDIWITTVVPAIVVVIVLIIALIIACCLYRKKRKGKMKLEEKKQFSSKGVPVIFADEYEEKPNDSTRPLIMDDEKPPMPPPEYQRASSETSGNSTNSTQPIEDKEIEEIEMEDTSEMSPLYSPPPPVTASSNNKPPHVPTSRGPPPYVPP